MTFIPTLLSTKTDMQSFTLIVYLIYKSPDFTVVGWFPD